MASSTSGVSGQDSAVSQAGDYSYPQIPPGRYQHYKGGEYDVEGVALHVDTNEFFVVYRGPLGGRFVRPFAEFVAIVSVNGVNRPRFSKSE